jgi:pyruvate-formate lyase-activating enzyme
MREAAAPEMYQFHIREPGGRNIVVEGNTWFMHAPEVEAYVTWAKDQIARLTDRALTAETENIRLRANAVRDAEALAGMREVLTDLKITADDLAQASVSEGDNKGAGALQWVSGFISDSLAALTPKETSDA